MAKNPFSDIVPPNRRSIREIHRSRKPNTVPVQPAVPRQPVIAEEESQTTGRTTEYQTPRGPMQNKFGGRGGMFFARYGIWFIALAVLLILIFTFSIFFAGSKIVVTPKQKDVTVNGEFLAVREPVAGQLSYDVVEFTDEESITVSSTGTESVEERATGTITVFNNFSEKSQRLITNTRFETPDGLIYRIQEPIVVPGFEKNADGSIKPGNIDVVVYADEPGTAYNIGLVDFTIPGFKGTPQFDGFHAESKAPMIGGFLGERAAVDEQTLEEARRGLEERLLTRLVERAWKEKPEDYVLFDDAIFIIFDEPILEEAGGDKANIRMRATASNVIFRSTELASHIASETVAGYDGENISIQSSENLSLTVADKATFIPSVGEDFSFNLSGSTHLIWEFDTDKLRSDLSGRSKEALPTILTGYTGIDTAEVILRPFWKQSFPDDPNKIKIDIR